MTNQFFVLQKEYALKDEPMCIYLGDSAQMSSNNVSLGYLLYFLLSWPRSHRKKSHPVPRKR